VLGALALCLLALPLFLRSPWADEIMLFLNFPPAFPEGIVQPLAWYYQAAPPLYNAVIGQFAHLRPETVRFLSMFLIALPSVFLLSRRSKPAATVAYALLAMLLFPRPFQMLSEMKHYGLEIVGGLLAVRWFIDKPSSETLRARDLLVLAASALTGFSTIPVAGIALGTHVLLRFAIRRQINGVEVLLGAAFGAFLVGYYLLAKHLMLYLEFGFTETYGAQTASENLKALLGCFARLGGGSLRLLLFLLIPAAFVAYWSKDNPLARRLTILAIVLLMAFVVLSALGIYPARRARFLTWTASILWTYVVTFLYLLPEESRFGHWQKVKYAFLGMVALTGINHTASLWSRIGQELSHTSNNAAIAQLRALPPSRIGLWAGGEPVIEYYRRFYPDLNKHDYFGHQNWKSRFEVFDPTTIDYLGRARTMMQEISKAGEFYVFASHYGIHRTDRYNQPKVEGLHTAFKDFACSYDTTNFKYATLYRVTECPSTDRSSAPPPHPSGTPALPLHSATPAHPLAITP